MTTVVDVVGCAYTLIILASLAALEEKSREEIGWRRERR